MRCDQPIRHEDRQLETPSEMFVQFMFQNNEPSDSESDDEFVPPVEPDTSEESSGDEAEVGSFSSFFQILNNAVAEMTQEDIADYSDTEQENHLIDLIHNVINEHEAELAHGASFNDLSDGHEEQWHSENEPSEVNEVNDNDTDVLSNNDNLCNPGKEDGEKYIVVDDSSNDCSDNNNPSSSNNSDDDSLERYVIIDEITDDFSEGRQSTKTSSTVTCVSLDDCDEVSEEKKDCESVSSNRATFGEASVHAGSSKNNHDGYNALSVTVPPASFCNELKNVLSEVSSDGFLFDVVAPVTIPLSLLYRSDESIPTENESLYTTNKICDNSDVVPSSSIVCSSSSATENDDHHSLSEMDFVSGMENNVSSVPKSENSPEFDVNLLPECVPCDPHLYSEMNVQREGNTSCDVGSDNSVPNFKRKASGSADENSIKKVPKVTFAQDSDDLLTMMPVESYSDKSSSDDENSTVEHTAGL